MIRSSLSLVTLALFAGCTQTNSASNLAAPLAASPATSASEPLTETAQTPDQPTNDAAAPHAAAKPVIAGVPPVLLSAAETDLCKLTVGDELPVIELPKYGGGDGELAKLLGERATIVLFWTPDQWMARTALGDIQRDIADDAEDRGVAVIGVIVGGQADAVQTELEKSGANFTQLVDAEGQTLARCGSPTLPRVYVLTADKKIVWFDIEYSETTRRELQATLAALAPADS